MNIYRELSGIASAKYGLGLKDPIYYALAKLVEYSKFELLHDRFNDDVGDYDKYLDYLFYNNETCAILANFMRMIYILNGRKAFYAKTAPTELVVEPGEDTILYWVNILGEELMHSGNGRSSSYNAYGIVWEGDGQINGSKIRAAMYYILELLSKDLVTYETPAIRVSSPFCFFGRDIEKIIISGTEDGIGYLNTSDNKYYIDVVIKDVFGLLQEEARESILIGDSKLYDSQELLYELPEGTYSSSSLYEVSIMEKDKSVVTEIELYFTSLRDTIYESGDNDYVYSTDNVTETSTSLSYIGNKKRLITPTTLGTMPLKTIGATTFGHSDVTTVVIQEGVTTIE